MLAVRDLVVRFAGRRDRPFAARPVVHAVNGVSFTVARGTAFGIVGESGSGKSTAALALMRLVRPTSGSIRIAGQDITALQGRALRTARRGFQMVFQDPFASLDPRRRVGALVREPMELLGVGDRADRNARAAALIEAVGLPRQAAEMFPHQFSGGQRQRVAIARALAPGPDLLVCDEPVSALDVSIQAQILNLLVRLRTELGLTMVFISHDLGVVQHVCDAVAVLYLGRIVEQAPTAALYGRPRHPYTWSLMAAAVAQGESGAAMRRRFLAPGEPPSPLAPPPGCHFSTRCPHAEARCRDTIPPLRVLDAGHHVACHRAEELDGPTFSHVAASPPEGVLASGAEGCGVVGTPGRR